MPELQAGTENRTATADVDFQNVAGNTTFGGEIVRALSQQSLVVSSRAAAVVTCMVDDNPAAKQRLLNIPLDLSPAVGRAPLLLMPQCLTLLSNALFSPGERGV